MDRITELLRLVEDSELPDTLSVWDICRLGYPENHHQQKRFLEFLTRHIAKGTLVTAGTVDLLEKDQPGYAVVTATVVGAGNPFRAYWDPSPLPARQPVSLLHQSALWALLDRTAFLPPPGPYLANWRVATPAPTSPLSPPAAPLTDDSRRDAGGPRSRSQEQREFANKGHAERNAWYDAKVAIAKQRWEGRETLRHDQMADELMKDATKGISKRTLLDRLSDVLKAMGKPELIRGKKIRNP